MLSSFIINNDEIEKKFQIIRQQYAMKDVQFSEGIFRFEDGLNLLLLNEVKEKLDNSLRVITCYLMTLVEFAVSQDVLDFHAEHVIIKLASFWEHLFQVLNVYLRVNMNSSKQIVQSTDESWKIKDEFLTRTGFVKNIKRIFINDKNLRNIVNIPNKEHWRYIVNLRNDIVHCNYLGQKIIVDYVGNDGSSSFSFNPQSNRPDYKKFSDILSLALKDIYYAMELAYKIVKQDLAPSKKESKKMEYNLIKVVCSNCSPDKVKLIPKDFLEMEKKLKDRTFRFVFCPDCLSDEISILDDFKVSHITWNDVYVNYIKLIPKYFKNKKEVLKRNENMT